MSRNPKTPWRPIVARAAALTVLGCALAAGMGGCAANWSPIGDRYRPSRANLEARSWFQDAKFGLFIHLGPYSALGEGEWVMNDRKLTNEAYEALAERFDPASYDARAWVALAEAAGARYLVVTAKHHDGFATFNSAQSDWDVFDASPYGRDLLDPLAEACRESAIKLFFSYSLLDWHHADYYPRGKSGRSSGRPQGGEWERYLEFVDDQLRELLMAYGEVGGVRLDGWWDRPEAEWGLKRMYRRIHRLQRGALIANNRHRPPTAGEDFQIWEKDLPGENSSGLHARSALGSLPLEMSETINRSWGYNAADEDLKSPAELIRLLVAAAGRGANLLLGFGAKGDGTIPAAFEQRLREMGRWLEANGESIHGTRAGPITPGEWGVSTAAENRIYIHYLAEGPGTLRFSDSIGDVRSAYLFSSGASLDFLHEEGDYVLEIPSRILDPIDTIVVLEVRARD